MIVKEHTRNQKRMYRIHKQEEKIQSLELLVGKLQQENKQLKDNWNKLKEYTQEKYDNPSWASCGARYVLEKMQELQGSRE